jgi:hypothetical protein
MELHVKKKGSIACSANTGTWFTCLQVSLWVSKSSLYFNCKSNFSALSFSKSEIDGPPNFCFTNLGLTDCLVITWNYPNGFGLYHFLTRSVRKSRIIEPKFPFQESKVKTMSHSSSRCGQSVDMTEAKGAYSTAEEGLSFSSYSATRTERREMDISSQPYNRWNIHKQWNAYLLWGYQAHHWIQGTSWMLLF